MAADRFRTKSKAKYRETGSEERIFYFIQQFVLKLIRGACV